jgi:RNA polymerase sigma-70 factor (ECF subfamily)
MEIQDIDISSPFEEARNAWQGVNFSKGTFARRVAELEVRPDDVVTRARDLYLAWACAEHDGAALAYFDRQFLQRIDGFVGRMRLGRDSVDELRQRLRIHLLMGDAPRIGQYRGRGSLAGWVRTCSVRTALDLIDTTKARTCDLDAVGAFIGDAAGPELAALRNRYGAAFQASLERTLASLEPREKTLLRMYFADELNIDAIGRIYRVHRATVARWIAAIRERVLASVCKDLRMELSATPSECRSILTALKSDLDISLSGVLASA